MSNAYAFMHVSMNAVAYEYVHFTRRRLVETNSTLCVVDEAEVTAVEYAWRLGLALILLVMSGTFSGLTLGLLGLDITGLDVRITCSSKIFYLYMMECPTVDAYFCSTRVANERKIESSPYSFARSLSKRRK